MKTFFAALLLSVPASAGFEADLAASRRAAGKLAFERPAAPKARAVALKTFAREGFEWASDAKSAAAEAESGLRAAGLPVLSSRVYAKDSRHGFTLEYVEDASPRPIESYEGGNYDFESEARAALNSATYNLTNAGYHVILARTLRQDGDYRFTVDFVARRRS